MTTSIRNSKDEMLETSRVPAELRSEYLAPGYGALALVASEVVVTDSVVVASCVRVVAGNINAEVSESIFVVVIATPRSEVAFVTESVMVSATMVDVGRVLVPHSTLMPFREQREMVEGANVKVAFEVALVGTKAVAVVFGIRETSAVTMAVCVLVVVV